MAELNIAITYATALYGVAKDVNKTVQIGDEIDEILELLNKDRRLDLLVKNPGIPVKDRQGAVEKLFTGKVSQETVNFMCVLIAKGRASQFAKIVMMYHHIVNENEGYTAGNIYSAVELSEEQIEQFEKQASKLLNENVKLYNIVDTKVIGGVKIYVDGKLIDASVRSELDKMLQKMKN